VTFQTAAYAVDGNSENGNFLRLMLQSATMGSSGVVGFLDCIVSANSPATSGIIVGPGAVVIAGTETSYQGSYYGYNVGNDTSLSIAATSGSVRSDMVVARAEDPTWSGSPWAGPASGQIVYPRVIQGVAAGSTSPPSGSGSCIALARIDMPASTSTVAQSYIHDLRTVSQPQRQMQAMGTGGPGTATSWTVSTTAHAWPPGASFSVQVPSWATTAVMMWQINDMLFQGGGTNWARGDLWPVFGSSVTAPNLSFPATLTSVSTSVTSIGSRHSVSGFAQASVGPSLRGTTQTLQFAQNTDGTQTGIEQVDEGSQVALLLEFQGNASLT
jgi:hypothetical protein